MKTHNYSKFAAALLLLALCSTVVSAQNAAPQTAPSRIVMGGRAVVMVADALYAFPSARERVVAVGIADQGLGAFLNAVAPGFNQKPGLDRAAGAEEYAALNPDLVILKSAMKARLGGDLDRLAIPALYLNLESPEDYYQELTTLGTILGDEARAAELVNYYRLTVQRAAAVAAAVAATAAAKPRVLVVQSSTSGLQIPPDAWIQTRMVELAGAQAVWKGQNPGSGWLTVNIEQIAAWNPDWLVVISYDERIDQVLAALKADARLRALPAVRSGRVAGFPQDFYSWDQPDTRWGLGLLWLTRTLHPELARGIDIGSEARRFFSLFYQMDEAAYRQHIQSRLSGL
ncbi:MAG: ABC transporter substrate-binding protein [Spirochaetes bacterium]|nr:ABC transporter substrate-binding protein [Spirochaetota bacterium]